MINIGKGIVVALFLSLMLPHHIKAQESSLGNWLIYIGSKELKSNWNLHHEVQYRNYNAIGDLEQLLLRTGAGYSFNQGANNVLLGYGYILSKNYNEITEGKVAINEHRIYEQFISKQAVNRIKLQHRYRFEQRFVEDNFKLRFRYFLGINVPLSPKESKNNLFYLSAYNELFLNSKSQVFDRNRLYGGIGYRLNNKIRFEIGYMNQFFESSNRDQINVLSFVNF